MKRNEFLLKMLSKTNTKILVNEFIWKTTNISFSEISIKHFYLEMTKEVLKNNLKYKI